MENNQQSPGSRPQNEREWKLIEKLLGQAQDEHRKARRWGIFFKLLTFVYLFAILGLMLAERNGSAITRAEPHVAVVDVKGLIAAEQNASADMIAHGLRKAFEAKNAKAVLLRINSPGGSPVQSNQAYSEVRRLREEYPDKKVYAVITDVGASGAYYIASAADKIYADQASIVGSIGVIMAGFGLQEAAEKLGVERRIFTAGNNKAILDPFSPVKPGQREHVQNMLENVHQQFIDAVKQGRGDRIDAEKHPELFSGLFWTGQQAKELGLVDDLKSPGQVIRDVVGLEEGVNYTTRRSPLEQFIRDFGVSIGEGVASSLGLEAEPTLR